MPMNAYQQQSLGMYQGYSSQVQGQQSLGMYHGYANPFLYPQNVSMPMFSSLVSAVGPFAQARDAA